MGECPDRVGESIAISRRWPVSVLGLLLAGTLLLTGCASKPVSTGPIPVPATSSASVGTTVAATRIPLATSAPTLRRVAYSKSNRRIYPNPHLTPGAVFHVSAAQVSKPGYASKVRKVSVSLKRKVYAEYHLSYPQARGAYECDHFVPLCLGGSNSIKNLWPEPAPQFHWKDRFELYLWHQVRKHKISLSKAQKEMRTDWYRYWVAAGKPSS